jgi:hypothetical protein
MGHDYDYYIAEAKKAVARSNGLWATVNGYILSMLELGKTNQTPLEEVAEILKGQAGRRRKNEATSMENLRAAARQIKAGENLVLL